MEYILLDVNEHVAIVTINRPKALNALSSQVLSELKQAFESLDLGVVRAVVLTGAGEKSFVAGADIDVMSQMTKSQGEEFSGLGNGIFRFIEKFPVPVICAINGFCLGGGNELAMSCDVRLASENAIFGQPEVGLGITAGFGGTQRLARLIGAGMAKELLYTGRNVKADEALRIGLVNAVYPLEQLMENALKMANKIAKNAPIAVRMTKEAIDQGLNLDIDSAVALEARLFGQCFESEDQVEGMKAFLEKRKVEKFNNR